MKEEARHHPKAPHNQPFMGAPTKKRNHWSNVRGHNNVNTRKDGAA